jgi:hypothetical protein
MSAFNSDINNNEGNHHGDKPKIVRSNYFSEWVLLDEVTLRPVRPVAMYSGHKTTKGEAIEFFILRGYKNVNAG